MEDLRLVSEGFLLLSGTPALSALEFAEAARRRRGCWCSSRLDVDEGAGARRGRSSTRGGGVLPGWLDADEERRGAGRGWWRSARAGAARRGARRRGRWDSRWRGGSTPDEGGSGSSRAPVGEAERRVRGGGVLPAWLDVDEERRGARRGWWRWSRAVAASRAARRRGRWVSRWRLGSTLVEGGSGSSRWLVGDEERRWLVEGGRDAAAA